MVAPVIRDLLTGAFQKGVLVNRRPPGRSDKRKGIGTVAERSSLQ